MEMPVHKKIQTFCREMDEISLQMRSLPHFARQLELFHCRAALPISISHLDVRFNLFDKLREDQKRPHPSPGSIKCHQFLLASQKCGVPPVVLQGGNSHPRARKCVLPLGAAREVKVGMSQPQCHGMGSSSPVPSGKCPIMGEQQLCLILSQPRALPCFYLFL